MSRKRKVVQYPVFFFADSLGLPLETVITKAMKKGWTIDGCILDFLLGAIQAGWSKGKVQSDIKELRLFIEVPDRWLFWADGALDNL